MMLIYYPPALYRRVICFIDPLEMIKDTVERRTRLLWPGEEEEEDVTPQLISATQYQTEKPTTQHTTHQPKSKRRYLEPHQGVGVFASIPALCRGRRRERLSSWRSRRSLTGSYSIMAQQFLSLILLSGESGGGVRPHRHQYWRVQSCQSTVHLPTFSLFSIKGIQTNHCLFYIFWLYK